jgi:RNA recognition motif-containing protein
LRIYVGNLSFDSSEEELQQSFSAYGQVESVTIIRDRYSGRSKGFAFVEMPSAAEAQAAIGALNGKEMKQRTLTVNEARPREERSTGGGGGGGRGFGGGGGRGQGGEGGRR